MPTTEQGAGLLNMVFMFGSVFLIFYVLVFRPEQKRKQAHAEMLKNLKKGDRVTTIGGIIGTIHTLQDDYVVLKIGDQDTKMEVLRSAIQEIRKS